MLRLESPFPEYALPRVWTWIKEYRHRVTDDTAPKTLEAFVTDWQNRQGARKTWGVWSDDDLGGLVVAEISPVGVAVCDALFKPQFRERSIIRAALVEILTQMFHGGVRKVMAMPFQGNCGMMNLFYSLGAKREGKLKAQTVRAGKPVDVVILSVFREEFERWAGSQPLEKSPAWAPASPAPPSPEAPASPSPPDSPASAPSAAP